MKKAKKKQNKKASQETINLSNEIIIGLTPKKDETKDTKKKKIKKTNKAKKKVVSAKKNLKTLNTKNKKVTNKKNHKIVKWTILILLIVILIIIIIYSPLFNIREIKVENNSKIASEEIISLSGIEKETNMYKYNSKKIEKEIKKNAYIESVDLKRKINGTVILDVNERVVTYMLKFSNAFVYINNQGYILEVTQTPIEVPIITGFETPGESIKEGNRLVVQDLEKLEDVIKIMNTARGTPLGGLITSIDITNKSNYIITIASENKTIQFGEAKNINVKLLKIQAVIEKEKDVSGEIYFEDSDKTIFRENV